MQESFKVKTGAPLNQTFMMTLDEQKLAVCEKLPELICADDKGTCFWKPDESQPPDLGDGYLAIPIHWSTEGLQVCHEAEKLLTTAQRMQYRHALTNIRRESKSYGERVCHATYEQRLEALCRLWWLERFE